MKKLVVGLVVCALAASAFVYGSKIVEKSTNNEDFSQQSASDFNMTEQGMPVADIDLENEDEYEIDEATIKANEEEQLNSYLSEIQTDVQPETPGHYEKTLRVSVEFLDWATYISLDDEEVRQQIATWISNMDDDEKAMFEESLYSMDEMIDELFGENGRDILEEHGYKDNAYPWNERAQEVKEILMEVAGIR